MSPPGIELKRSITCIRSSLLEIVEAAGGAGGMPGKPSGKTSMMEYVGTRKQYVLKNGEGDIRFQKTAVADRTCFLLAEELLKPQNGIVRIRGVAVHAAMIVRAAVYSLSIVETPITEVYIFPTSLQIRIESNHIVTHFKVQSYACTFSFQHPLEYLIYIGIKYEYSSVSVSSTVGYQTIAALTGNDVVIESAKGGIESMEGGAHRERVWYCMVVVPETGKTQWMRFGYTINFLVQETQMLKVSPAKRTKHNMSSQGSEWLSGLYNNIPALYVMDINDGVISMDNGQHQCASDGAGDRSHANHHNVVWHPYELTCGQKGYSKSGTLGNELEGWFHAGRVKWR
ncbi:hypothetical protein C8R44DRAFT_723825 [Mycena epipterygia]|nr:hypothetical protein C8R44DRAFT_723825 [Mycena epipterygia]